MAGIAPTRRIAIALGSNVDSILGTRSEHLNAALRALDAPPRTVVTASSRFIETEPVGPIGQGRYLNAAACLDTTLEPAALLARLLEIERERGRAVPERPGGGRGPSISTCCCTRTIASMSPA